MEELIKTREKLVTEYDSLCDKYNELLKQFKNKSTKKTKVEKIEEIVSRKIELEKIDNRITILSKVIGAIDTKISLSESIENIDFIKKIQSNIIVTSESVNDALNKILEESYQKLDILSTKKVLIKEFKKERLKGLDKYDFGPSVLIGIIIVGILGIILPNILSIPFSLTNLFLTYGILFTGSLITTMHLQIKRIKQRIEVFNNLNNQLGKDAITNENNNYSEEYYYVENLIDTRIENMMIIEIIQREYKTALEYCSKDIKENGQNRHQLNNHPLNYTSKYMEQTEYGTIIANSGRWAGYEDIPSHYPSKLANECSCRTERDDTIEPGVLYRHLEEDDEDIQEENGPKRVRKK